MDKTNLYVRDNDKILISQLVVNKENFIKYNKKRINKLIDIDSNTSDIFYIKNRTINFNVDRYRKIYQDDKFKNICYIPYVKQTTQSIYSKFTREYLNDINIKNDLNFIKESLDNLPYSQNIVIASNNYNVQYFYQSSKEINTVLKLDKELTLLYKLLYIKNYVINKTDIENVDTKEFKEIFKLIFSEVITYDTYCDIIHKYDIDVRLYDINEKIDLDEQKSKMIKLILK